MAAVLTSRVRSRFIHAAAIMLAAFFCTAMAAQSVGAAQGQPVLALAEILPSAKLDDIGRGSLLIVDDESQSLLLAPRVAANVEITVGGLVARARVSQTFFNPSQGWVEGIYVFPLPENAAVDHLLLRVGDRVIEGQIKEREEARRVYEQAKSEGKKAGLLEGERPNIFTTSIANIGPGEEVTIDIEYQHVLRYDQGAFSLRFPMVIGPRYIPGNVQVVSYDGSGAGWLAGTDRVPDADRITPPVLRPEFGKINPVHLRITLAPGFPLADVASPYHDVTVTEQAGNEYVVELKDGAVPADRDFELVWTPVVGAAPGAGLFTEALDGEHYLLLMVMPPSIAPAGDEAPTLPREVIFVIDTSGSMAGTSISQAKAALGMALDRLAPGDRFNVIQFNNNTSSLYRDARTMDAQTRRQAKRYVQRLTTDGGTNMRPALHQALAGTAPRGFFRQIVFLTDGAVGNERELFGVIEAGLGDSRLFTVGIGSAPNSFFMSKAAEVGRGTFAYIGQIDEVAERMGELFAKLERPVLTDLKITWPDGIEAETSTAIVPDLYAGEPVVLTARVGALQGGIAITGRIGQQGWRAELKLADSAPAPGTANLWARDRIDRLMNQLHEGADPALVRAGVVTLGLKHHLVTKYTSLVAVDVTPTRPLDQPLSSQEMPTNLPEGWEFDKVFGEALKLKAPDQQDVSSPQTNASSMSAEMEPMAMVAAKPPAQIGVVTGLGLPQGATPAPMHLLAGVALVLLGLTVLGVWRRRA